MAVLHAHAALRPPVALLLDTDNTLYPYDPAHTAAMQAVRSKAQRVLGVPADEFDAAFRAARADIHRQLKGTASSHSRLLYFQRTIEGLGLKTQILLTLDLEQTYWRTFLSEAVLFEGAKEFLEDVRRLGVPIANLTDLTAQIQFRKLVYFGIEALVDFVVTSEEAGRDKPDPLPFHLALRKLGLTSGEGVWMVGDNPVCDVQGSREACGAVTFQKTHEGVVAGTGPQRPDVAFEHFAELRRLLSACASGPGGARGAPAPD
ncbi:MAG: HAD family hydrolase [Gemmatimonadetes bacterium]|nr:HAD family hydrolase [Gemmatimonadota bacterium]